MRVRHVAGLRLALIQTYCDSNRISHSPHFSYHSAFFNHLECQVKWHQKISLPENLPKDTEKDVFHVYIE